MATLRRRAAPPSLAVSVFLEVELNTRFPLFVRTIAAARRGSLFIALAMFFSFATPAVIAADLTVFAAASLKEALDANVRDFMAKTGHQVRVSYAASNALAKQIESGAPAQLFISADEEWMDYLVKQALIVAPTRRDLLTNDLVIIAPANSTVRLDIAPGFPLVAALGGGRLSLANPDVVPAGKYAKAALTKLGVWSAVASQVAGAENVRAALAFVARGETPLGIVYRTDALAEPRVRIVATFGADLHPPIVYPAAIVAGQDSPVARALLDALASADARATWRKFGFAIARDR